MVFVHLILFVLVVELKARDAVKDAIQLLYEENLSGAAIADVVESDATVGRISDHYMVFIDFVGLFVWSLEVSISLNISSVIYGICVHKFLEYISTKH